MRLEGLNIQAEHVLEGDYGYFRYFCPEIPQIEGKHRTLINANLKFAKSLLNYVNTHDFDLISLEKADLYVEAVQSEYDRLVAMKE